jgi:ABC-type uncharacterized transport system permease subunit
MFFVFYHIAAAILYTALSLYFIHRFIKQQAPSSSSALCLICIAILLKGIGLYQGMVLADGINLAIHNMLSLVTFSVNTLVLISSLRKPLHSLFILLLPISTVTAVIAILLEHPYLTSHINHKAYVSLSIGISLHILLSVIAYSLLFAAVLQALLLSWQNYRLKHKHIGGITKHLPPLQTMETLLFELIWVGVILLTIGLIFGVYYIDNIFSQHLAHKTILSLIAWVIFATLLCGRTFRGWRGNHVIRWILGGFCALMLAYFGSKLVLEVILQSLIPR